MIAGSEVGAVPGVTAGPADDLAVELVSWTAAHIAWHRLGWRRRILRLSKGGGWSVHGSYNNPERETGMKDLAVVIVSYNVRERLGECLDSLFQSAGVGFDVCVVDNASSDGSTAFVRER